MADVRSPGGCDVHIPSTDEKAAVLDEAAALRERVQDDASTEIGTEGFAAALGQAVERVRSQQREPAPWSCQNDFALVPELGLVEMRSGGQLDDSDARAQVEKPLRGALALGDPELALHWALSSADQGEGSPPNSLLLRYLTCAADASGALVVGSQWWEALLPVGTPFVQLVGVVAAVGQHPALAAPGEV